MARNCIIVFRTRTQGPKPNSDSWDYFVDGVGSHWPLRTAVYISRTQKCSENPVCACLEETWNSLGIHAIWEASRQRFFTPSLDNAKYSKVETFSYPSIKNKRFFALQSTDASRNKGSLSWGKRIS